MLNLLPVCFEMQLSYTVVHVVVVVLCVHQCGKGSRLLAYLVRFRIALHCHSGWFQPHMHHLNDFVDRLCCARFSLICEDCV